MIWRRQIMVTLDANRGPVIIGEIFPFIPVGLNRDILLSLPPPLNSLLRAFRGLHINRSGCLVDQWDSICSSIYSYITPFLGSHTHPWSRLATTSHHWPTLAPSIPSISTLSSMFYIARTPRLVSSLKKRRSELPLGHLPLSYETPVFLPKY